MSCVTCGDSTVKLWKFELVTLPNLGRKVLSLLHYKTLQLDDSILCAKVSPDNKLLAVALLDNTIKIFFLDTFKVYISLYSIYYGHIFFNIFVATRVTYFLLKMTSVMSCIYAHSIY